MVTPPEVAAGGSTVIVVAMSCVAAVTSVICTLKIYGFGVVGTCENMISKSPDIPTGIGVPAAYVTTLPERLSAQSSIPLTNDALDRYVQPPAGIVICTLLRLCAEQPLFEIVHVIRTLLLPAGTLDGVATTTVPDEANVSVPEGAVGVV